MAISNKLNNWLTELLIIKNYDQKSKLSEDSICYIKNPIKKFKQALKLNAQQVNQI